MPHDVITQLLRVLAIETKQEKAIINAEPTDVALSGLEAFSFDYIVKWPLSLIINRLCSAADGCLILLLCFLVSCASDLLLPSRTVVINKCCFYFLMLKEMEFKSKQRFLRSV